VPGQANLQFLTLSQGGAADKDTAIAELKKAYDLVQAARKASGSGESRTYLDAARDLYNAARREAEAGRFDRAAELARAAKALTLVPKHLGTLKLDQKFDVHVSPHEGGMQIYRFDTKDGKAEVHVEGGKVVTGKAEQPRMIVPGDVQIFRHESKDGKPEIRIESRKRVETKDKPEAKSDATDAHAGPKKPEAKDGADGKDGDDAAPTEGIGIMINFEDGKVGIQDLIPGGPAAKDGRIKKGDAIIGVETDSGAVIGFGDKALPEVTKLLRGPAGSKVKLIVQPSGSKDHKVYEIERKTLEFPKDKDVKPTDATGEKGRSLPPQID